MVGARLPHTWITPRQTHLAPVDVSYVTELSAEEARCRKYSMLDLCEPSQFTLIGDLQVPGVKSFRLGQDFEVIQPEGDWWLERTGLLEGGGLLVRPDQHILMVLTAETTTQDVEKVIRGHLCL